MQTLRPFSESENDLSMQQMRNKSVIFNDGENAFAQPRGKGQERGVTFKGTPGVASTRKALGNITNQKGTDDLPLPPPPPRILAAPTYPPSCTVPHGKLLPR